VAILLDTFSLSWARWRPIFKVRGLGFVPAGHKLTKPDDRQRDLVLRLVGVAQCGFRGSPLQGGAQADIASNISLLVRASARDRRRHRAIRRFSI
jgi:hypothetical protein